jgi:integrase
MHAFAKAAGRYEALVRTFTDTGMRLLGEVLPLRPEDFDGETLQSAAPLTRAGSSRAPRPTTARRTPAA